MNNTLFSWDTDTLLFDFDEEVQAYFTEGQCPALAYELHKLTGWTIAMLSSYPQGSPHYLAHVFVMDSDGTVIDIRGRRPFTEVKDEWYFCGNLHRFWDLKEFEHEMIEWELAIRFDKDKKAKFWAKKIVELLK